MLPHALSIFDLAILHTARKWQIGKLINLTMFGKGMSKDKVLSVITGAKMLKVFAAIFFIIFWDFLMFHQIFLSPQVKRCAIITYKHGICELPKDLGLRILGNCLVPIPPAKKKILLILVKKSRKIPIKPFPQCFIPYEN